MNNTFSIIIQGIAIVILAVAVVMQGDTIADLEELVNLMNIQQQQLSTIVIMEHK